MCLAIPAEVITVNAGTAHLLIGQRIRKASTQFLPDVRVGEYVLVSGGFIVERVSAEEARETLAMLAAIEEVCHEKP